MIELQHWLTISCRDCLDLDARDSCIMFDPYSKYRRIWTGHTLRKVRLGLVQNLIVGFPFIYLCRVIKEAEEKERIFFHTLFDIFANH